MRQRPCLLLTTLFVLLPYLGRADAEADKLFTKVRATYAAMKTMSATYTEAVVSGGKTKATSHSVKLMKQNRARVETNNTEEHSIYIIDGKKATYYYPDTKEIQELDADMSARIPFSTVRPLGAFYGASFATEGANYRKAGEETIDGVKCILLKDQAGKSSLYIGPDNVIRRSINSFAFANRGEKSVITLTNVKINPNLNPSEFVFTPPKGAKKLP